MSVAVASAWPGKAAFSGEVPCGRRDSSSDIGNSPQPEPRLSMPSRCADTECRTGQSSERVRALSARLLVLPAAWDGWATIHVAPCQVFALCMVASFSALFVNSVGLSIASKPVGWVVLIPVMVYCASHLASILLVWRCGPMVSKTKVHRTLVTLFSAMLLWVGMRLTVWRGHYIPLGSHLAFSCFLAVGTGGINFAAMLGFWPEDHPERPHSSFKVPALGAATRLLRLVDAFTDMMVIRMMLNKGTVRALLQAQAPCYWFGAERACARWLAMAACAGLAAALDLAISLALAFFGISAQGSGLDERKRRILFRAHVASFSCEIAILSVTLVKLFCDFQEPSAATSPAERRNAVTLTLGSFAVTIASFCLTMLGMNRVLGAVNRVGVELRARISRASVHNSHHPAVGRLQPVEAVGVADAQA